MRLFSRPSHYQIAFLLLFVGIAWGVRGEQVLQHKGLKPSTPPSKHPGTVHKGFVQIGKTKSPPRSGPMSKVVIFQGRVLGENPQEGTSSTAPNIPLPRVKLELVPLGKGRHSSQGILSFASKEDGLFQVGRMIPGRYMLRALPNDGKHLSKAIAVEVPASPAGNDPKEGSATPRYEQEILLPLPRKMLGHLKPGNPTKKEGLDRRGFWISVSENGLHRGTAKTDQEGAFQLNGVGTGPYDFTLRDQDGEVLPVNQISVHPDPAHHKVQVSLSTPE